MTRFEMERRAAEWMGVDLTKLWNIPPAYGSDLNLWPPIYAKLDALSRLDEYAGQEPDRLFCEALEAIACERLKLVGYNAGLAYIGATAEDRLRALIAVIGEGK